MMEFSSIYKELFYLYNLYLQDETPLTASGWWDTHPIEYPLDHMTLDSIERFAMMSSFEYPL